MAGWFLKGGVARFHKIGSVLPPLGRNLDAKIYRGLTQFAEGVRYGTVRMRTEFKTTPNGRQGGSSMRVVFGIFKRIQLFCFAFTLASSSMLFIGIATGRLDRGPVYMGVAEQFASVLASHPLFVGAMGNGHRPATGATGPHSVSQETQSGSLVTAAGRTLGQSVRPAGESLQNLHARKHRLGYEAHLKKAEDAQVARN